MFRSVLVGHVVARADSSLWRVPSYPSHKKSLSSEDTINFA